TTTTNANTTGVVPSAPVEVIRYWIDLDPAAEGGQRTQVAGLVPIASGERFKFHFTFGEDGYLYVVGPGEKNQPTAFLTTKPSPRTGLKTNKVSKGVEFGFPQDDQDNVHSLELDTKPGTDTFTIIFSKVPLEAPAFLSEPVNGNPLSTEQQAELKTFVSKSQSKAPVIELDESNAKAPFFKVKAAPDQTNTIVFDIRIQHN
ncbi:MAG TPA: DUF4384 domain-containing protein, partial [Pyrinomonadaceae bacterium]|nr:DUF4384 domain-containing protein [Pyrinomonadaceae bacterium]